MVRNFKMHSLSNLQICNTALNSRHAVHYTSVTYLLYNWKFVPCESFHLFHLLPTPHLKNHNSSLCIHELGFLLSLILFLRFYI